MPLQETDVPMDEIALTGLGDLLEERGVPHGGMPLEMLDGFFSALIVGPETVMPSEYLPHVWGDAPEWETLEHARDGLTAVMRFWNHIVWRVRQPIDEDGSAADQSILIPPFGLPAFLEEETDPDTIDKDDPLAGIPEDFPFAAAWAAGFLFGMSLRQPQWQQWVDQDEDLQADIGLLLSLAGLDEASAEPPLDLKERFALAMEVPGMLQDMYLLRMEALRPKPMRRTEVPGRNDPCPCGSGRKYKKCCGNDATLH